MSVNSQIDDIMRDVDALDGMDEGAARGLKARIRCAIEALPGQACSPDPGPWKVSKEGDIIWSDCFDHDVALRVSGDFYNGPARVAYSRALQPF